jgi:uncharacterized protein YndB with AHSA1/START domain
VRRRRRWAAVTEPDRLKRWLFPVIGDLRPGASYQLEGSVGGDIRRCEPPGELTVTWGGETCRYGPPGYGGALSATTAPRSPSGRSGPTVESCTV